MTISPFSRFHFLSVAALIGTLALAVPAQAQLFGRPPAAVPDADDGYGTSRGPDAAQTTVRIDRLENQIRTLNGRIEQLEYANRRLEEALQKFQRDVDFRLGDGGGATARPGAGAVPVPPPARPGRRSELDSANGQDHAAAPIAGEPAVIDAPAGRRGRGDAFDPASAPNAPGAPRALGQVASTDPLLDGRADPNAPLDLRSPAARSGAVGSVPGASPAPGGAVANPPNPPMPPPAPRESSLGARPIGVVPRGEVAAAPPPAPGAPNVIPGAGPVPPTASAGVRTTPGGTVLAGLPAAATPKEEFDLALVALNNGQFDSAETGFRGFLGRYPKDKLTPDAVFYLGDSFWKRGRAREAAEQYLKVSTDYSKSARAPEALVRLGLALERLGAKEQACATWGEVGRKYPAAPVAVRNGADREAKRLSC